MTPGPGRFALIIASGTFDDPAFRALRAPAQDAAELARVLGDDQVGGFSVQTSADEPMHLVLERVEEFFADRSPGDLLVLYFTGHGVKDDSGELHFVCRTTKLNRLASTAVSAAFVNRCMDRCRARSIVLLLDCCYSGAFARSMLAKADGTVQLAEQFPGRGRAIVTASRALEYAFEGGELTGSSGVPQASHFTHALVTGLDTGAADRDGDGLITLDELYDFVHERVREVSPRQTPGLWQLGVEGRLVIARSRTAPADARLTDVLQSTDGPLRPVTLTAPARLMVWQTVLLAACLGLMLEGFLHGAFLRASFFLFLAWAAGDALHRSMGGVCFSDDGMLVRSALRTRLIPWREVVGVEALRTPLGRSVLVHRVTLLNHGRRTILPSPRTHVFARDADFDAKVAAIQRWRDRLSSAPRTAPTGAVRRLWYLCAYLAVPVMLLAQSLVFEGAYWSQPWWPWRHEAASLPHPCDLFTAAPAPAALVGEGEGMRSGRDEHERACGWRSRTGPDPEFTLTLRRFDYELLKTGSDNARDDFDQKLGWPASLRRPLTHLGEKAYMTNPDYLRPDGMNHIVVLVLRANVVVEVTYDGKMPPGPAAEHAERIARTTMTRIDHSFQHRLLGLIKV
ncbi:caspase family protein [Streptomyces sp. Ru71]|uniref:caspase family protein n=1 Tax=Streptomyces sp. Ru71 TaxID=2080746 RepID=UPI0015E405F0|nr:caspase family protein [Streptomyces sp. Ru71]